MHNNRSNCYSCIWRTVFITQSVRGVEYGVNKSTKAKVKFPAILQDHIVLCYHLSMLLKNVLVCVFVLLVD